MAHKVQIRNFSPNVGVCDSHFDCDMANRGPGYTGNCRRPTRWRRRIVGAGSWRYRGADKNVPLADCPMAHQDRAHRTWPGRNRRLVTVRWLKQPQKCAIFFTKADAIHFLGTLGKTKPAFTFLGFHWHDGGTVGALLFVSTKAWERFWLSLGRGPLWCLFCRLRGGNGIFRLYGNRFLCRLLGA